MENKVRVTIFGNTYNIQGDAPPEYILRLAAFVNEKMEEVSRSVRGANTLQTAILAALNIADEYHQMKDARIGITGALEQKTKALISMLDEGLIGDIFAKCDSSINNAQRTT
jgi:cell division protein ZapA